LILNKDGPFDEPSFCFENGFALAQYNGYFRQAIAQFERVSELVTNYLPARIWLGQLYLASRLTDRAMDALSGPLNSPEKFSLAETNETQINLLMAAVYFQKNDLARGSKLLETEISRHPGDTNLLFTAAQAYLARGLFTNALSVINRKLELTPDDPVWLFSKGYVSIQLKNYDDGIADLTRVLSIQTNNPQALFNRAVANLASDRLDAAHADYEALRQTYTNSFQIFYGLGEIARLKHETNDAIRNYQMYLASAPTNTAEATNIIEQLKSLQR
jgi:tetratricopeptide (TPR) repeat protein